MIVCVPTSAFTGVPEIVVPEMVMVLGAPLIEYVMVSLASTSVHMPSTSRLYAESSAIDPSVSDVATVGASLELATVRV